MFWLEQQYDLNAKFITTINSLFSQERSLSSEIIALCGIKFWIMMSSALAKKVNFFINIDIRWLLTSQTDQ